METKAAGNEVMWTTHADPARDQRARKERPKHIPFDLAGHAERPHCSIGDRRNLRDPVRPGCALRGDAAGPGAGLRGQLPVGARRQRHHHRGSAAVAIRRVAQPRAAAAVDRVSVHGSSGGDPRPHLPGTVRTDRAVGRQLTDHGLALHDLARRVSAVRAGLWLAQGRQRRQQDRRTDRASHRARRPRRDRRDGCHRLDRHGAARSAAGPAQETAATPPP